MLKVEIFFLRLLPGYSTVPLIVIYQVISGSACHLLPIEMMDVYMKVDSVSYRKECLLTTPTKDECRHVIWPEHYEIVSK